MKRYILYVVCAAFPISSVQADWLTQLKDAAQQYQTPQAERAKLEQQKQAQTQATQPGFLQQLRQLWQQAYEEMQKEQAAAKNAPASTPTATQSQPSFAERLRQLYEQSQQKPTAPQQQKQPSWWDLLMGGTK